MFKNPFSFEGRIRRSEYGISFIIYWIAILILPSIMESGQGAEIIGLAYIPLLWFMLAQSAKRCHDRGNSGWYQIIPFYRLWLLFGDSDNGVNEYGPDPKEISNQEPTNNI